MEQAKKIVDLEQERKDILKRFKALFESVEPMMKGDDSKQIKAAFKLSAEAHKEMRRKSGEPYIFHPIEVAQICVTEIGLGPTAVIAALLHDVVEDTDISLKEIEKQFGEKVARIIDGLTKIKENFEQNTSQQAENFRKMILTISDDVRVILIKLADRLHNMRTLGSMSRSGQLKIASETIYVYAPLAHRLGLYGLKSELEDLYLKYTEPQAFREIEDKLQDSKTNRDKFIKSFMEPLKTRLTDAGLSFKIKGRPKHIYSIWNKIKKQGTAFEDIYDLFAIRIVLQNLTLEQEKAACWQAYSIVTDNYVPNPDRLKDWVSTPRANGYESLHTTVMSDIGQWVEVQVRTQRMDEIAEKGVAAHFKYKENDSNTNDKKNRTSQIDNWLASVRENLESGDMSAIEFLEDFRGNLYNKEVFVFTPKGELKVLRKGATVLDFAFDIHTQVGGKCTAGKVNNRLVPISHVLTNGDQVNIVTTAKQKPSEDWLRFVVTSKAKAKIKDLLKEENKVYLTDGKEMIAKRLKTLGIENSLEVQNQLRAFFNKKDSNDLFNAFGKGYIHVDELKKFKTQKEAKENKQAKQALTEDAFKDAKTFEKALKKISNSDILLIGDDKDKIDYTLSPCCNPIAGDDVFGFLTINEGIKIHRTGCNNARELLSRYGHRLIKARWASEAANDFLAIIRITGIDRVGIIQDISGVISTRLNVNMRAISVETNQGLFEGVIKLEVNDTSHLEDLMQKLGKIEGIFNVVRFEN